MVASLDSLNKTVSTGGGPRDYIVKTKDGTFDKTPVNEQELTPPTPGFYTVIELKGISEPFQMASGFEKEADGTPKMQSMVRLLFRPAGTEFMFAQMFNFESVSPRTQLGKIFGAIRKSDIEPGTQLDNAFWGEVLGGTFGGMVQIDRKVNNGVTREYAKIVKDTVVPAQESSQAKGKKNPLLED